MTYRTLSVVSVAAVLLFSGVTSSAQAGQEWVIDYGRSKLSFVGSQGGQAFQGRFTAFTATVDFDPKQPEKGKIEVEVDTSSARTGDEERDQALPTAEWFAVSKFPKAQFKSQTITAVRGNGSAASTCFEAIGDLNIKGAAKSIAIPFCLSEAGRDTHVSGKVILSRNDYGVGQGEWSNDKVVQFPVDVLIDLTARKKD